MFHRFLPALLVLSPLSVPASLFAEAASPAKPASTHTAQANAQVLSPAFLG